MKIGNYEIGGAMFSGMGGMVLNIFYVIGIVLVLSIGGFLLYRGFKKKAQFIYPVTLTHLYENGTKKTRADLRGGKFVNMNGVFDFKCQMPKQRKHKELGFMPDLSKADADGRLYFLTSGDGTIWQQYENRLMKEEDGKDAYGNIKYKFINVVEPVPIEDKIYTVNAIKNWRETVDKAKITTFAIAIGAFIIMVIAHLISLYIQTKIKCPVA